MKKWTVIEELLAVDTTLALLEYWAWRAEQGQNQQLAESYSRGHAAFEEQRQKMLWSLEPDAVKAYEAARRAKKSAGKTVKPKKPKKVLKSKKK